MTDGRISRLHHLRAERCAWKPTAGLRATGCCRSRPSAPTRVAPASKSWILLLVLALEIPIPVSAETAYFHIDVQPMPVALALFAEQAHMQVLYDYQAAALVQCNEVIGEMEKREALARLLVNTGLEAAFSSPTAVTVRHARRPNVQSTPAPPRVPSH